MRERFEAQSVCVKCSSVLTDWQIVYGEGVCPYCGGIGTGKNKKGWTLCDFKVIAVPKPPSIWHRIATRFGLLDD